MKKTITHRGQQLTFTIVQNRRYRRFVIRPHAKNHYRISAPANASKKAIDQAINQNIDAALSLPAYQTIPDQIIDTLMMPVFGRFYPITFDNKLKAHNTSHIVIDIKQGESKRHALLRHLKPQFLKAIYGALSCDVYQSLNPNLETMTIKIRYMRSQFGGCVASKNQISLNLDLMHYPKRFLHYVIAHEMVHFKHANHSKAFYDTLHQVWPNWREDRQSLNAFSRLAHYNSIMDLVDDDMSESLRRSL